ncbi:MAG: ArsR/SmtB family transcription factor [Alphaproteobacteria bacterium]
MIARKKIVSLRPARLTDDQTAELADMLALLGESSRLKIVLACLDGAASVGAIAASAGLSPSLASHHLRLLRAARLLRAERQGKQVFYTIMDDHVRCVIVDMVEHVMEPDGRED